MKRIVNADDRKLPFLNDVPKEWEEIWQDMPEYIRKPRNPPFHEIRVRFRNEEDMDAFSKLVDQKVEKKTVAIWYPKMAKKKLTHLRYVDES